MIWYATFPRCGNSYAENILKAAGYDFRDSPKYEGVQVCKTHNLMDEGAAIHQIRHPLDVFCSMKVYYNKPNAEIMERMDNYAEHYEFYLNREDTVLVRYEYALNYPDAVINAAKQLGEEPTRDAHQLPTFAEWREILPKGRKRLQRGIAGRYKDEIKDKGIIKALAPLCETMGYEYESK